MNSFFRPRCSGFSCPLSTAVHCPTSVVDSSMRTILISNIKYGDYVLFLVLLIFDLKYWLFAVKEVIVWEQCWRERPEASIEVQCPQCPLPPDLYCIVYHIELYCIISMLYIINENQFNALIALWEAILNGYWFHPKGFWWSAYLKKFKSREKHHLCYFEGNNPRWSETLWRL